MVAKLWVAWSRVGGIKLKAKSSFIPEPLHSLLQLGKKAHTKKQKESKIADFILKQLVWRSAQGPEFQ